MLQSVRHRRHSAFRKCISFLIVLSFSLSLFNPPSGYAQLALNLPAPGTMVGISPSFTPVIMRGIKIFPDNPLQFDFIVDKGDTGMSGQALEAESLKLVKYFFASLTIPEKELWVNLSPYEKDRIITDEFSQTDMGRDLLSQDYILKQLTASLMFPEKDLGKQFWARVYKRAFELYGTTEIPVNTFNKVWIIPDKATIFMQGDTAIVAESHLKVMLEEDYLSMMNNLDDKKRGTDMMDKKDVEALNTVTAQVVKEILIPEIEKEVNEGQNFAALRQINNALILAVWYKKNLKESLLGQIYADKGKTKGIDIEDTDSKEKIYAQYLEAFKKGVYNLIKEDVDPGTKQSIPRKYFSGGYETSYQGKSLIDRVVEVRGRANLKLLPATATGVTETEVAAKNKKIYVVHTGALELGPNSSSRLKIVEDMEERKRAPTLALVEDDIDLADVAMVTTPQIVGNVDVEGTVMRGAVRVRNQSANRIKLSDLKSKLPTDDQGRVVLDDVSVFVDEGGNLRSIRKVTTDPAVKDWRIKIKGKDYTAREILDRIIKEYDVRGFDGFGDLEKFPKQMDDLILRWMGRALASVDFTSKVHEQTVGLMPGDTFVIGGDNGPSTEWMKGSLAEGLRDAGINIVDLGTISSGHLYSSIKRLKAKGGLYVTRSHVEIGTNGMKPVVNGITLYGDMLQALKPMIETGRFEMVAEAERGTLTKDNSIRGQYAKQYHDSLRKEFGALKRKEFGALKAALDRLPMKITVNLNGGSAVRYKKLVQEMLGNHVVKFFRDKSDPRNENGGLADPSRKDAVALSHPKANIMEYSLKHPDEIIFNFDLDADRVSIVQNGELYLGDEMFYPIIEYMLTIDQYKDLNKTFYYDSRMKTEFRDLVEHFGGTAKLHPKGHSKVKATMDMMLRNLAQREGKSVEKFLADHPGFRIAQAEFSLHMFLSNASGENFDDAIRFFMFWLEAFTKVKEKHGKPKWTLQEYIIDLRQKKIVKTSIQLPEQRTSMPEDAKKGVMLEMKDRTIKYFQTQHAQHGDQFEFVSDWRSFEGAKKPFTLIDVDGVFHLITPIGDAFWGWSNTSPKVAFGTQGASGADRRKLTEVVMALLQESRDAVAQKMGISLPMVEDTETVALRTIFEADTVATVERAIRFQYANAEQALQVLATSQPETDPAMISRHVDRAVTALSDLHLEARDISSALASSSNRRKILDDFAESVGISPDQALKNMMASGMARQAAGQKGLDYTFTARFYTPEVIEEFRQAQIQSSQNPALVDLTNLRLERIILSAVDPDKFIATIAQGEEPQKLGKVISSFANTATFPTLVAAWLMDRRLRSPDNADEVISLRAQDIVADSGDYQGVAQVEFGIFPDSALVDRNKFGAVRHYQRSVIDRDLSLGQFNYRGTGTKQTVDQYFRDFFAPQWYGTIQDFVRGQFNNGRGLKALVTNGIGANDQFMWSLVEMYNRNRPPDAPVWYHVVTARDLAGLPKDLNGDNTLVVDISRSGSTWEGVEVKSRLVSRGFKKMIVLANGGDLKDIADKANRETPGTALTIGMQPDIGGRNMHRKTPIYYTVQTIAGMFLPGMDSKVFAGLNHEFDKANDFSDPNSLGVNAARFIHSMMMLRGAEHVAFMSNSGQLRLIGDELSQYFMEGANKEHVISFGAHDLTTEPAAVLENLAKSPAAQTVVGIAILDQASPNYRDEVARVNLAGNSGIPMMVFTINSADAQKVKPGWKGISPQQQAAFDILWTDLITALTTFLRVDANSNPNVKVVRTKTAQYVAQWRATAERYAQDPIGRGEAKMLVSLADPGNPAIGTADKQRAIKDSTEAAALGIEMAQQLASQGLIAGRDRLNLFAGSDDLMGLMQTLRNQTFSTGLLTKYGFITETGIYPLRAHKGHEATLAFSQDPKHPLLANKSVNLFLSQRRLGSDAAFEEAFSDQTSGGKYENVEGATIHQTNDSMTMPNIQRAAEVSPTILFEYDTADTDIEGLVSAFYRAFVGELEQQYDTADTAMIRGITASLPAGYYEGYMRQMIAYGAPVLASPRFVSPLLEALPIVIRDDDQKFRENRKKALESLHVLAALAARAKGAEKAMYSGFLNALADGVQENPTTDKLVASFVADPERLENLVIQFVNLMGQHPLIRELLDQVNGGFISFFRNTKSLANQLAGLFKDIGLYESTMILSANDPILSELMAINLPGGGALKGEDITPISTLLSDRAVIEEYLKYVHVKKGVALFRPMIVRSILGSIRSTDPKDQENKRKAVLTQLRVLGDLASKPVNYGTTVYDSFLSALVEDIESKEYRLREANGEPYVGQPFSLVWDLIINPSGMTDMLLQLATRMQEHPTFGQSFSAVAGDLRMFFLERQIEAGNLTGFFRDWDAVMGVPDNKTLFGDLIDVNFPKRDAAMIFSRKIWQEDLAPKGYNERQTSGQSTFFTDGRWDFTFDSIIDHDGNSLILLTAFDDGRQVGQRELHVPLPNNVLEAEEMITDLRKELIKPITDSTVLTTIRIRDDIELPVLGLDEELTFSDRVRIHRVLLLLAQTVSAEDVVELVDLGVDGTREPEVYKLGNRWLIDPNVNLSLRGSERAVAELVGHLRPTGEQKIEKENVQLGTVKKYVAEHSTTAVEHDKFDVRLRVGDRNLAVLGLDTQAVARGFFAPSTQGADELQAFLDAALQEKVVDKIEVATLVDQIARARAWDLRKQTDKDGIIDLLSRIKSDLERSKSEISDDNVIIEVARNPQKTQVSPVWHNKRLVKIVFALETIPALEAVTEPVGDLAMVSDQMNQRLRSLAATTDQAVIDRLIAELERISAEPAAQADALKAEMRDNTFFGDESAAFFELELATAQMAQRLVFLIDRYRAEGKTYLQELLRDAELLRRQTVVADKTAAVNKTVAQSRSGIGERPSDLAMVGLLEQKNLFEGVSVPEYLPDDDELFEQPAEPVIVERPQPQRAVATKNRRTAVATSAAPRLPSKAPGGINLDPALLDLQIKRDDRGVPLPMPKNQIRNIQIEGVLPVIIYITPVNSLPMILGEVQEQEVEEISRL